MTALLDDAVMARVREAAGAKRSGRLTELRGLHLLVRGVDVAIGDVVEVEGQDGVVPAEAVASTPAGTVCLPLGSTHGLRVGARAASTGGPLRVHVGEQLTGRVLDGLGRPIDGGPALTGLPMVSVENAAPHPLERSRVDRQVGLGVRALDALVPAGRGQRVGIFAGSGVGKSTLMGQIARQTEADVNVIALVGERGREVVDFLEESLGPAGRARSVVVCATSDAPSLVRLRAVQVATAIAEWFRERRGASVLLLCDSLTRVARAQREVGLSAGEPPARHGYPPSVFALLPRLIECTGATPAGVITAITTPEQRGDAVTLRRLMAAHRDVRELVEIGAYAAGSSPDADRAIALLPRINDFLRQAVEAPTPSGDTWRMLHDLVGDA